MGSGLCNNVKLNRLKENADTSVQCEVPKGRICVCLWRRDDDAWLWTHQQDNKIHPKEIMLIAQTRRSTLHPHRKNQMCISTGMYVTCKGLSTVRCSKDESLRTNSFFPSLWRGRSYNKRTLWANFDGSFCHQSFRIFFVCKTRIVILVFVRCTGVILDYRTQTQWMTMIQGINPCLVSVPTVNKTSNPL